MTLPQVVTRDEWLVARRELLAEEKAVTRARTAMHERRRALPMVRVDKEYRFDGPDGEVTLAELFDGRRQLIVYHFMFDPSWDEGCPSCSLVGDSLTHPAHLRVTDTSLVFVSRAPIAKLQRWRERMGWDVRWVSSFHNDFNYDYHVTNDGSVAPVEYNYKDRATLERDGQAYATTGEHQGVSVFLRDGEDIYHTYSSYARGPEELIGVYNLLDLTPLGRQRYVNEFPYHDVSND